MIKLELTLEEVNMLLSGLGKLPYEMVFQIVMKVQAQAQEQLNQPKSE